MAELVTQRQYCEEMEGMFASAGWRKHWKPKLQELRHSAVESLIYNQFGRLEQFLGAQLEIQVLDHLLGMEDGVRALRQHLINNPEDGVLVVQSQDKDPEVEAVIGPTV